MPRYRTSTRVYWHGVFPDKRRIGYVASPGAGDLRTPVRWQDDNAARPVVLVPNDALMSFAAKCGCGYCTPPPPPTILWRYADADASSITADLPHPLNVQIGDDGRGTWGWLLTDTSTPGHDTLAEGYAATQRAACEAAEAAILRQLATCSAVAPVAPVADAPDLLGALQQSIEKARALRQSWPVDDPYPRRLLESCVTRQNQAVDPSGPGNTVEGYRASCSCGWRTELLPTHEQGERAISAHLGRGTTDDED